MQNKSVRNNMKKKNKNLKISFRSPQFKKNLYKHEPTYKVVTQNCIGEDVKVPTENIKPSFIKFNNKLLPTPLKNKQEISLIKIIGRKKYKFEDALIIYENNQSYYLDIIIKDTSKAEFILKEVESLERWFCQIPEPKPEDDDEIEAWKERENFKQIYGYSKYFDPTLLYYYCKIN